MSFVFVGRGYDEIVIAVGGWRLGRYCDKGGKVAFGAKL